MQIGTEARGSRHAATGPAPSPTSGCGQENPLQTRAFLTSQQLLDRLLAERGLRPTFEAVGGGISRRPLMPVATRALGQMTYMDDVAIPIEVTHCGQLFPCLAAVAEVALLAAKALALIVNWAAGKTEAIVGLHCAGLTEARKELAGMEVLQEGGRPLPRLPFPGGALLRIVDSHKRLGRSATGSGCRRRSPFGAPALPRLRPPCGSRPSATTAS